MTTFSIAVSSVVALCCGLVCGRCLRGVRAGSALALSLAVAVGLLLLRSAGFDDLLRIIHPKVAADWLPAIVLLAAFSNMIRQASFRVVAALVLAAFVPMRLLWGSVYFRPDHLSASVVLCVVPWFAVLAVSLLFVDEVPQKRMSWRTFVWGAGIAVTAATIASTGSLTYGAATGVCGVATLGVLLSASRIPNLAAFPIVCLIGLSTSYSELPILTSGLLFSVWLSLLAGERITSDRFVSFTRAAAMSALFLAGLITFMQLKDSRGTVGG